MDPSVEQNGDLLGEGEHAVSKPIKKRVLDDDDVGDEEDDDDTNEDNESSHRGSYSGHQERASDHHDNISYESKAKKELYAFLSQKGIDAAKEARDFQVHVQIIKKRKSNASTPGDGKSTSFKVTYSGPDGFIYESKGDVLSSIRDSLNRRRSKSGGAGGRSRSEIVEMANTRFTDSGGDVPVTLDGITVLKFGEIDVSNSAFQSLVQIYPTGYKAEMTLPAAHPVPGGRIEYRPATPVTVEVVNNEHFPEFVITVKSTGQSYWASSELAAWRKFDPFADESYSFFNLQVELLIEGMPGADLCHDYKFHEERGYGHTYTSQEGSVATKAEFVNKGERERRTHERQRARHLRPEEIERNAELQRRREKDEKDHSKRLEALEKERKVVEREQERKKKEQDREAQKEQRERQRREDAAIRDKQKQEDRVARERSKISDKVRSQYRKEFSQELKRIRGDANSAVLQFFDEEETLHETQQHILGGADDDSRDNGNDNGNDLADDNNYNYNNSGARQLNALFDSIPSCDDVFGLRLAAGIEKPSSAKPADWEDRTEILKSVPLDWDDVFQVANCLYAFRNFLNLQTPISLNILVDYLVRLAEAGLPPGPPKVAEEKPSSSSVTSSATAATAVTRNSEDIADTSVATTTTAMDVVEDSSKAESKEDMTASAAADDNKVAVSSSSDTTSAAAEAKEQQPKEEGAAKTASVAGTTAAVATAGAATVSSAVAAVSSAYSKKAEAIEGEEEWDESAPVTTSNSSSSAAADTSSSRAGRGEDSYSHKLSSVGRPKKQGAVETEVVVSDHTLLNAAQAALDRIHLCIVRALFSELHGVLDLDDREVVDTGRKQKTVSTKLPLNQLTWAECARMILVNQILSDQGRSKEDIQHALRGSRAPNFRLAKNVARYIRYRLAARTKAENTDRSLAVKNGGEEGSPLLSHPPIAAGIDQEDRLYGSFQSQLDLPQPNQVPKLMSKIGGEDDDEGASQQQFDSETEILAALLDVSIDSEKKYSEVYQRCAKVLIKIVNLNQSKNFLWEVDSVAFPDYYTTIVRPIMLINIANSLIGQAYGEDYQLVAGTFFNDVRQVFVNCFTYNTEITPLVAQAQKVYHVLWRHAKLWLFAPRDELPPIGICDETHCLLTHNSIASPQTSIKCGRCCGSFAVDDLYDLARSHNAVNSTSLAETVSESVVKRIAPFVILPSDEVRDQQSEEWFCPFCLSEDTSKTASEVPFFLDEWGPSTLVPWIFHPGHSNFASLLREEGEDGGGSQASQNPSLRRMLEAVMILSTPHKSSIVHVDRSVMDTSLVREIDFSVTEPWSFRDRIRVLAGLCEVLKIAPGAVEMLEGVNEECEKLSKICTKNSFREADFMNVVRKIAGEEGVTACRSLLDGIEDGHEADLQNRITDGRCTICKGSTYESEMAEDEEVILCDGCNAEVHFSCLNLTSVPNTAWYCGACVDRQALRDARAGQTFDDVNRHRDREVEGDLTDRSLDRKAALSTGKSWAPCERCAYCRLDELDVCSPLVVGMTRAEHDAYVASCKPTVADGVFPDKNGTKVKFLVDGDEVETPTLDVPYFPIIDTVHGTELLQKADVERREAMVVHQICALQMFQARIDRNKHMIRRRRSVVAQRALNMAGVSSRALGTDDSGREYWRFPSSDDLFVRDTGGVIVADEDEVSFKKQLLLKNSTSSADSHGDDDEFNESMDVDREEGEVEGHGGAGNEESSDDDDDDIFVIKDETGDSPLKKDKHSPEKKNVASTLHTASAATASAASSSLAIVPASAPPAPVVVKKTWKRISDVHQMRRIVELLSDSSPKEAKLRGNLVSGLLCDKKTDSGHSDASPAVSSASASASSSDLAPAAEAGEGGGAVGVKDDVGVKEDVPGEEDTPATSVITSATGSGRTVKKIVTNVVDNVPAELRLIRAKGQDVPRKVVIPLENVFIDELEDTDDDDEEDDGHSQSFKSFFNFSKGRYYAIGLLNSSGKTIKGLKSTVTITYQIHREGISQPVAFTPLSDPWSDNLYYFNPPSFKRSGNYTISFIVEGANTTGVKPLVFPLVVTSQQKCCSAMEAINRLQCLSYVHLGNRQFSTRRSRDSESLFHVIQNGHSQWTPHTELHALKRAIASVYLALPAGSLQLSTNDTVGDVFISISEPSGWNDVLDQAWRGAVETATSPATLMECVLLLEHYLNKAWLEAPHSKLLNALASHHFAVRCATYSSVALRVYCLDKSLAYNKVVQPSRERRGAVEIPPAQPSNSRSSSSQHSSAAAAAAAADAGYGRRQRATPKGFYAEDKYEDVDDDAPRATSRSERDSRRGKKREEEEEEEEDDYAQDDDEEEEEEEEYDDEDDAGRGPSGWTCEGCTCENSARARTCDACGARKPTTATSGAASRAGGRGRDRDRKRKRYSDYDEDEEEAEFDDQDRGTRQSSRSKKAVVSYAAADDDGSDEDDEGVHSNNRSYKRGSGGGSTSSRSPRYDEGAGDESSALIDFQGPITALKDRLKVEKEQGQTSDADITDTGIRMLSVLRQLYADRDTEIFWEPVNTKVYRNYKQYVSEPMDLGTITENVKNDVFSADHSLFAKKVRLVWNNCKIYNKGSPLEKTAERLGKLFEKLYSDYILSSDRPANPDIV